MSSRLLKSILRIAGALLVVLLIAGAELARKAYWFESMSEAVALGNQGRPKEALARYERAELLARFDLLDGDALLATRFGMGIAYQDLGRHEEAERLFLSTIGGMEKAMGNANPRFAVVLDRLSGLYEQQGRMEDAEREGRRALQIVERAFPDGDLRVCDALTNLADLLVRRGSLGEAESLAQRALDMVHRLSPGVQRPETARSLLALAKVQLARSNIYEGASFGRQSVAAMEATVGAHHLYVAITTDQLARAYLRLKMFETAVPLFERALAIEEKAWGPDNSQLAVTLEWLAAALRGAKRYQDAERHALRSLSLLEKRFGANHPKVAESLLALADSKRQRTRYAEAEPLYRRAIAILEGQSEREPHALVRALSGLAELQRATGRNAEAGPLYRRALALNEKASGPDGGDAEWLLVNLSAHLEAQGDTAAALAAIRRSTGLLRARYAAETQASEREQLAERRSMIGAFYSHVRLLHAGAGADPAVLEESFEAAQRAQLSTTSTRLLRMAARFASRDAALVELARGREDARLRLERAWIDATRLASANASQRAAAEGRLREEQARLQRELAALDTRLEREFPSYRELIDPQPARAAELQRLLRPGEALAVFLIGNRASFAWLLRHDRARFDRVAATREALEARVRALRAHLDLSTGVPTEMLARPFPVGTAHALYQELFAPFADILDDVQHLIVVPDAALTSLPLGVLVTKAPKPADAGLRELRSVHWLAARHALTTLPSAGSLRALRAFERGARAPEPFVGFGDPLLDGGPATQRADAAQLFGRGGVADVRELRKLARLPDTANELAAIARTLRAPPSALHLREAASERTVKQLELARYRTVAFATHGLVGGQLPGVAEPALVLSPPAQPSALDDGLLTASEVAQLRLAADWVILSACNTAAADGTPGAEGFSGLARSFFHAGARSLLVSHWPVNSQAATALTTRMFREYAAGVPQAESLRRAMLALAKRSDYLAHPALWAPFVVVGEGAGP